MKPQPLTGRCMWRRWIFPREGEFFGGKPALGGLDNRKEGVLYSGNEEEIRKAVRELIETCGKKGFLLGADCTIPGDLPAEHVRWVLEEARSI